MKNNRAPRGGFLRDATWLVGGNVLARIITFALMPVITRLFPPEAFGAFAGFNSILTILVAICHLRYCNAVFLPEDERDVDALAALTLLIVLCSTLLTALAVWALGPAVSAWPKLHGHADLLWLLPPGVFFGGVHLLQLNSATRHRSFGTIAAARIAATVSERSAGVSIGLWGTADAMGLAASRVLHSLVMSAVLLRSSRILAAAALPFTHGWARIKAVAVRYADFPKYALTALLQQGSLQLPVLVLMSAFSPAIAGFFALSRSVLREPINLVGEALARVYTEHAASLLRENSDIRALTHRFFDVLISLSFTPLFLVAAAAPEIFGLVFGKEWSQTGQYAQVLMPFYAITFISHPLSALFDLHERQRTRFHFDGAYFLLSATALGIGLAGADSLRTVLLFSCVSSAVYLYRIVWLLGLTGISAAAALSDLAKGLAKAVPFVAVLLGVSQATHNSLLTCATALLLAVAHLGLTAYLSPDLREALGQRRGR